MIILKNLKNIFSITELRKKVFFTLGVLVVYRLGTYIPVIGVDVNRLRDFMQGASKLSGVLAYLDVFSGGALAQCTLFSLGIMPYITASIMMQLLGFTVPYFEQLLKEGEFGRRIINQYTRYLSLGLSIVYSSMYATGLEMSGLVIEPDWTFRVVFILSLTVGCMAVMWLGEQISLFGIGNGSSMIIFAGIVSRFPDYVLKTIHAVQTNQLDALIALMIWMAFVAITACIIFLERGDRKIPVQYARKIIGNRVYGGQNSYIPFKINSASVMPVIFATNLLSMPLGLVALLAKKYKFFSFLAEKFSQTGLLYNSLQFILVIFFYFAYTAMVFNPTELADNIKKSGGFIPGVRPGRKTAEFFDHILTRLGLVGAFYLGILTVLPNIMAALVTMPFYLSGTALLIVVGVGLDTSAQIESYLIEHNYEGFLSTGRLRQRGAR